MPSKGSELARGGRTAPPPFRISPSTIARYFFHDCERFLRWAAATKETRAAQKIPERDYDRSPLIDAILESGYAWEEQVVANQLDGKVTRANGPGKLHEQRLGIEETLHHLRTEKPGRWLYQATLRPPARFYEDHGIDRDLVLVSDSYADLIRVDDDGHGMRRLVVTDLKRGESLRPAHQVQVLLYALELDAIIKEARIDDARVDLEWGAVWLGGQPSAREFDLSGLRPHLLKFLKEDLARILQQEARNAAWHLHFRCEWCPYFDECRTEMEASDDLSRIANLTTYGKRHLVREAGVKDLAQLGRFLERVDADEILSRCASLAGERHHLTNKVAALSEGKPRLHGSSSPALPKGENFALHVTVQREPLGKLVYLAGVLVQAKAENLEQVLGEGKAKPTVWVADGPADAPRVRAELVGRLHGVLSRVHEFNVGKTWEQQLSLQVYVHNEQERSLLMETLLEALGEPTLAERAMTLLLHFQGPDLVLADEHPSGTVHYPVVVLLSALGRIFALPVDVSYRLPESLTALGSSFDYRRNEHWHFPLGHGLKAENIHAAWYRGDPRRVEWTQKAGEQLLWATHALLRAMRERAGDQLFAWPPKFALQDAAPIRDPLLSKLAFFARYESVLRCLAVKDQRAEALPIQTLLGHVIELEAETDRDMKVIGAPPVELDAGGPPGFLLVPADERGRRAQLNYPDYFYRGGFVGKEHPDRAVVGLAEVDSDATTGVPKRVVLDIARPFESGPPEPGKRYRLHARFTDYNTDRVIKFIQELDQAGGSFFLELLRDPTTASTAAPLSTNVEATSRAEAKRLGLTESQLDAYTAIRTRRATAVWGPPGTGKTHFLASAILGLASAHEKHRKPFRVLVTAFTHAAIENVLRKVGELLGKPGALVSRLAVGKAKEWRTAGPPPGATVEEVKLGAWTRDNQVSVVGATVWSLIKSLKKDDLAFDLVIVDEASQVRVPEAAVPVSLVADGGRLVLAGDDLQLPPIVSGAYPEQAEGEPVLHRSIFEAVRSRPSAEALVQKLLENFRMNDVLTSYARELLYGEGYRCATKKVAARRLPLRRMTRPSPLTMAALEPTHPLVLVVLDGLPGGKENPVEAGFVADVVNALREGLLDADGQPYRTDEAFFRRGVFVVSPHHAQIRLIRRELAKRRSWEAPPFVDTVEKMQGQESDAVVVSYGVTDPELALREAEFIYGINRLNVAITRARSKTVVFLPRPLLDASPQVLEVEAAAEGLGFMRRLADRLASVGERLTIPVGGGVTAEVLRALSPLGRGKGAPR